MRVLDLFSGIGGFSLGLERAGMQTVAFCEYEEFPRQVLAKHWPGVPCYPCVRELTKEKLIEDGIMADAVSGECDRRADIERREPQGRTAVTGHGSRGHRPNDSGASAATIDLICGGYPCQPFSHAGKRAGAEDDRHLWPEMFRLIDTIRPRWVLAENVAGHISMGLDDALSDLEGAGYAWWSFVIPACAVDAKHRRDRVWIVARRGVFQGQDAIPGGVCAVAHADGTGSQRLPSGRGNGKLATQPTDQWTARCREVLADTLLCGQPRPGKPVHAEYSAQAGDGETTEFEHGSGLQQWLPEPAVGRVAHGVPNRVDRLKALGNAVVPQVVEVIGRAIMECER